jgi:hypothetical protein
MTLRDKTPPPHTYVRLDSLSRLTSRSRELRLSTWQRSYSDIGRPPSVETPTRFFDPICHYVIVRGDLPRGVQAAQIVHAVGESLQATHAPETYAVVLTARDELHLALIAEGLERRGVALVRIREPDENDQLMALGLRPARKESLRRHLSSLPLLK